MNSLVSSNAANAPLTKLARDNSQAGIVFVSHAASDESIALLLKAALETASPAIRVFVSSDPEDLKPGDAWVDVILANLRQARLVIVLATQRALSRKWVWYESGATWSRGARVVPCCLGVLRKGSLPPPFSTFQALNIDETQDFQNLIAIIAEELDLPDPEPLDLSVSIQRLIEANAKILSANPAFLPSEEIERRLGVVQLGVRLDQGSGEWFMLLVENQSAEEIQIEEMVLETKDGHRLTNPARPKPTETWKIEPRGRLSIQCQLQPDPCVQLLTLHNWPASNFPTDVNFKFLCHALNHEKWYGRLLRVQVDRGARRIWPLVG